MPEHHQITLTLRKTGPNGGRSLNSAAGELCVNARNLRKWDSGIAKAPDNVVKLLAYVVGLDTLEAVERAGPEALRDVLGGDPTIANIRSFLESVFQENDPLNDRIGESQD